MTQSIIYKSTKDILENHKKIVDKGLKIEELYGDKYPTAIDELFLIFTQAARTWMEERGIAPHTMGIFKFYQDVDIFETEDCMLHANLNDKKYHWNKNSGWVQDK